MKEYLKKIVLCVVAIASLFSLASCNNGVVKGDPSKVKYFETIEECYIEYCKDQEADMVTNVAVLTFIDGLEDNVEDSYLIDVLYKTAVSYENYVKISDYLKTSLNYLTSRGLNVYVINTTKKDLGAFVEEHRSGIVRYKYNFYPFSICKNAYLGSLLNDFFEGEARYNTLIECLDSLIKY